MYEFVRVCVHMCVEVRGVTGIRHVVAGVNLYLFSECIFAKQNSIYNQQQGIKI